VVVIAPAEPFRIAVFESATERLTVHVSVAVAAAIAIVRVSVSGVTRVRIIAPVLDVVVSVFAAHSETVPVGSTFELLRVATV
jgi:hypothetical protein